MTYADQLTQYLKQKFETGQVDGPSLVVSLFAVEKNGKIKPSDIQTILKDIFENNLRGLIRSLKTAKEVINEEMLDEILREAKQKTSE